MSDEFDPNRNPFTRQTFAETFQVELELHPLERQRLQRHFKEQNPRGYQHDLGAADVFMDNFGLLFKEQAEASTWKQYEFTVHEFLFQRWFQLENRVLKGRPWWGAHFNNPRHRANSGGPKGLLRLLLDEQLTLRTTDSDAAPSGAFMSYWPTAE
jgi:hypothetical protein